MAGSLQRREAVPSQRLSYRLTRTLFVLVAAAVALATAAAASAARAGVPAVPEPSVIGEARGDAMLTADEQQLALGRAIPGFGGMFVGEDGALHVYARDPTAAAAAAAGGWLEKTLGAALRIDRGDFTFAELLAWKRALAPAMALPGAASLDVDEARNRVVLGVRRGIATADRDRIGEAVADAGVPAGAVLVEEVAPFAPIPSAVAARAAKSRTRTTLRDTFRPIPGGVQIGWLCDGTTCRWCTDTFTAFRGRTLGFVTCSHCSHTRGAVDGTRYVQSSPTSGGEVGSEIVDPPFTSCNGGRRCRGSDAVFVRFDKKGLGSFAGLARPASRDPVLGSLVLTPAGARLNVVGAGAPPLAGDVVHKIGRTTGWTYGPVVATCMDVNLEDSDITLTCQTAVAAGVGVGDSGSPVFTREGNNGALLQGIVWGAGEIDDRDTLIFSPLAAIDRELGPLRFH